MNWNTATFRSKPLQNKCPSDLRAIRILADDLTGALDAAAAFATVDAPVHLISSGVCDRAGKLTISSESRNIPIADSRDAVLRAFQLLKAGTVGDLQEPTIWFKKVDSVLRGNSLAETIAMMRQGDFSACIFAPAFPEMGRRTRNGIHELRHDTGWAPALIHDLRAAFAAQGVAAELFTPDCPIEGIVIGNALVQADLDRLVAHCRNLTNILSAGSRGLPQALAPAFHSRPQPRLGAIIVGTAHPLTRKQMIHAVAKAQIMVNAPVILDPVPMTKNAAETTAILMRDVAKLSVRPGSGLMVIGGDTLSTVLAASKAHSMECLGEISPGLPVSRILGGQFDRIEMVTKSGGFGDEAMLERMIG